MAPELVLRGNSHGRHAYQKAIMTYPVAISIGAGVVVAVLLLWRVLRRRRPRRPLRQRDVGLQIQQFHGKRDDRR